MLFAAEARGQIGSLDTNYALGTGLQRDNESGGWFRIAPYGEGAIVVGTFTNVNGTNRYHVARLDNDGALDLSFDPGTGVQYSGIPTVQCITVQPDGKILIGGSFTNVNGVYRNRIARLEANGSVDLSFECNPGPNASIEQILVQPDGKLLVGGHFTEWSLASRRFVVRLKNDGRSDYEYDTSSNTVQPLGMGLQPDGKLIVGGYPDFEPNSRVPILRLNTNGSRDLTFYTTVEFGINALALEPNGKLVIAGSFQHVNGAPRNNIARLNPDGTTDLTFDAHLPDTTGNYVMCIARCPDGKWLVGGYFTVEAGYPSSHILRLNTDGTFDPSFDCGSGPNSLVSKACFQNGHVSQSRIAARNTKLRK